MAQEVFVSLIDDLDGSGADETIMFALDGTEYEIDLNAKNAAALRKGLDKYVAHARKTAGPSAPRRRPSARRAAGSAGPDPKAVRVWAQSNGFEISTRGRVPAEIINRYRAAGGA